MWPLYLPLVTLAYNTFNTSNLASYSPYELVFGRKPTLLLDLEINPNIKVSGIQDFKSKGLVMINKDRNFFQYNSVDLVYIISPFTSQLRTSSIVL